MCCQVQFINHKFEYTISFKDTLIYGKNIVLLHDSFVLPTYIAYVANDLHLVSNMTIHNYMCLLMPILVMISLLLLKPCKDVLWI